LQQRVNASRKSHLTELEQVYRGTRKGYAVDMHRALIPHCIKSIGGIDGTYFSKVTAVKVELDD